MSVTSFFKTLDTMANNMASGNFKVGLTLEDSLYLYVDKVDPNKSASSIDAGLEVTHGKDKGSLLPERIDLSCTVVSGAQKKP